MRCGGLDEKIPARARKNGKVSAMRRECHSVYVTVQGNQPECCACSKHSTPTRVESEARNQPRKRREEKKKKEKEKKDRIFPNGHQLSVISSEEESTLTRTGEEDDRPVKAGGSSSGYGICELCSSFRTKLVHFWGEKARCGHQFVSASLFFFPLTPMEPMVIRVGGKGCAGQGASGWEC